MIDPAVDVALLRLRHRALEPGPRGLELAGLRQAIAHQVQACAQARMIDPAVDVALLRFRHRALEPWPRRLVLADLVKRLAERLSIRDRNSRRFRIPAAQLGWIRQQKRRDRRAIRVAEKLGAMAIIRRACARTISVKSRNHWVNSTPRR